METISQNQDIKTVTQVVKASTWDGDSMIAHQITAEVTGPIDRRMLLEHFFDITSDTVVRVLACERWLHLPDLPQVATQVEFSSLPKDVQVTLRGIAFSRLFNRHYT